MGKIKAWTDHIIRHFWYCSNVCKLNPTTSDENIESNEGMSPGGVPVYTVHPCLKYCGRTYDNKPNFVDLLLFV